MERCDECGFVYADLGPVDIPQALRGAAAAYAPILASSADDVVRAHTVPDTWSALEYSCHVRDVLVVQHERLALALATVCPTFVPMGREELVVERSYNQQDPGVVGDEIVRAADDLGAAFEALDATQWERVGIYNWPEPKERTMTWLGQHTVHEERHHLSDVLRLVERARGRS